MLGLLDFVVGIVDTFAYRRLYVGVALTALACWLLVLMIPLQPAQWIICVPFGIGGVFFTFRWQQRSDNDT